MKTFKITAITVVALLLSLNLFSQDFAIPKDVKLDKDEDYANYEEDIVDCINWLENTPLNEQDKKKIGKYFFYSVVNRSTKCFNRD